MILFLCLRFIRHGFFLGGGFILLSRCWRTIESFSSFHTSAPRHTAASVSGFQCSGTSSTHAMSVEVLLRSGSQGENAHEDLFMNRSVTVPKKEVSSRL